MRWLLIVFLSSVGLSAALAAQPDIDLTVIPLSQTMTRDHIPTVSLTITNHGSAGVNTRREWGNATSCTDCAQYAPYLKIRDENGQWPLLTPAGESYLGHQNPIEPPENQGKQRFFARGSSLFLLQPNASDTQTFNLNDLCILKSGHTYYLSFGADAFMLDKAGTKIHVLSNTVMLTVK